MTKVPLTFTAEEPNVGIEIHSSEDFYPDNIMLETSINNGSTWQPFVIDETKIILNNVGDSVMFRNSSNTIQSMAEGGGERYTTFILTGGKVAASGNIMFLLDKTGELRDLQKAYPKESEEVELYEDFKDWDGTTGYHLNSYNFIDVANRLVSYNKGLEK